MEDENNGFRKTKVLNSIKVIATCKPSTYCALLESGKNAEVNLVRQLAKDYDDTVNFSLELGPAVGRRNLLAHQVSSKQQIEGRIDYLNFGFENDIALMSGGQMIKPVLYHFERTYDLTPSKNCTFAFPKINADTDYTLVINSEELGLIDVKFKFDKSKIENLPNFNF